MILNDRQIIDAAFNSRMIDPFKAVSVSEPGIISYGLSSFGYDARLADKINRVTMVYDDIGTEQALIDPKDFPKEIVDEREKEGVYYIPANSYALGMTKEYFRIPKDIMAICLGKSTYARCGLIVNVTPLEPGWEGHVTLELSNTSPYPVKVYANEGICQFLFFSGDEPDICYSDRGGKYNKQLEITFPKVN